MGNKIRVFTLPDRGLRDVWPCVAHAQWADVLRAKNLRQTFVFLAKHCERCPSPFTNEAGSFRAWTGEAVITHSRMLGSFPPTVQVLL